MFLVYIAVAFNLWFELPGYWSLSVRRAVSLHLQLVMWGKLHVGIYSKGDYSSHPLLQSVVVTINIGEWGLVDVTGRCQLLRCTVASSNLRSLYKQQIRT